MTRTPNFGKVVRKYRKQQKLSQEELAVKAGVTVSTINRIERGKTPHGNNAERIIEILQIPSGELGEGFASLDQQVIPAGGTITLVVLAQSGNKSVILGQMQVSASVFGQPPRVGAGDHVTDTESTAGKSAERGSPQKR